MCILLGLWLVAAHRYGPGIVPGPVDVWDRFVSAWKEGIFWPAVGTTALEAALGWGLGCVTGLSLGYALGRWRAVELTVAPYVSASQAMPVLAIAPLLVIWLGFGLEPKVVVAALIVLFPVMTTTMAGIRGIDRSLRDVAVVFGAGFFQTIVFLEAPVAARSIFAGLKIGAVLSVTGAVVGEYVSSDQGLGYLVQFGRFQFDTPLTFVALIALMLLGGLAYAALSTLERLVLRWTE